MRSIAYLALVLAFALLMTVVCRSDEQHIRDNAIDSVCRVITPTGIGTGVYVGDGWVATAKHVLAGDQIAECVCEFRWVKVKCQRGHFDKYGNDIALIKLVDIPENVPAQKIARSGTETRGAIVYLAGFDRGNPRQLMVWTGYIGNNRPDLDRSSSIHASNGRKSVSGNSGGPIWNADHEVVSVISGGADAGNPEYFNGRIVGYTEKAESVGARAGPLYDFFVRVNGPIVKRIEQQQWGSVYCPPGSTSRGSDPVVRSNPPTTPTIPPHSHKHEHELPEHSHPAVPHTHDQVAEHTHPLADHSHVEVPEHSHDPQKIDTDAIVATVLARIPSQEIDSNKLRKMVEDEVRQALADAKVDVYLYYESKNLDRTTIPLNGQIGVDVFDILKRK